MNELSEEIKLDIREYIRESAGMDDNWSYYLFLLELVSEIMRVFELDDDYEADVIFMISDYICRGKNE